MLPLLTAALPAITERMVILAECLAAGLVLGELLSIPLLSPLLRRGHRRLSALHRKLNREKRSAATRVYRGMIALGVVLAPAVLAGMALAQPTPLAQTASMLLLVALGGEAFQSTALLRSLRAARREQLPLMLGGTLHTDAHGVLRQALLDSAQRFAVIVVGGGCWFVLAGPVGMAFYLALAAAHAHFGQGGFGWAARGLFRFADALPRLFACLLLGVGALFVPHTHPWRACRERQLYGFIAELLGVSLGGLVSTALGTTVIPWLGDGTARAEASHLLAWLLVRLAAMAILLILFLMPTAYPFSL